MTPQTRRRHRAAPPLLPYSLFYIVYSPPSFLARQIVSPVQAAGDPGGLEHGARGWGMGGEIAGHADEDVARLARSPRLELGVLADAGFEHLVAVELTVL